MDRREKWQHSGAGDASCAWLVFRRASVSAPRRCVPLSRGRGVAAAAHTPDALVTREESRRRGHFAAGQTGRRSPRRSPRPYINTFPQAEGSAARPVLIGWKRK